MKKIPLSLILIFISLFTICESVLSANFKGDFSVDLKIGLDALTFFTLENGTGGTHTLSSNTEGSGQVSQLIQPSSTLWELDDTFSFLDFNYEGGTIEGSVGSDEGSASATVLGTSKRLVVTNNGVGANNLTIMGTYSADLQTTIDNSLESAELDFNFKVLTESGQILGNINEMISGNSSFTAMNQTFNLNILSVPVGETIYIESEMSGSASANGKEVPEPLTILGTAITLGFCALFKKIKARKS